jgi:hypothetical protein
VHLAPLLTLALVALNPAPSESAPEAEPAPAYGLDDHSRTIPARGKVKCPKIPMTRYKGDHIRYHKPVTVYEGFVPRLKLFEQVVASVAVEVYGRAPRKIRHLGTYNCRRIRSYPEWLSEHAFGNGIDVAAFEFAALPRADRKSSPLPNRLRRGFKVSVEEHWGKTQGVAGAHHAKFLDTLARRLVNRPDIFRVLLGPGYPGHHNHFHFDVGPYRMVEIW